MQVGWSLSGFLEILRCGSFKEAYVSSRLPKSSLLLKAASLLLMLKSSRYKNREIKLRKQNLRARKEWICFDLLLR